MRHDLRLVPVGQDVRDVVTQDVTGFLADQFGRFEDLALGCVLGLDRFELFLAARSKQILEQLIEARAILHRALGRATFIQHRHSRAILFGFADGVAIDELAENLVRALLLTHDDGCTREADLGAVRHAGHQIGMQVVGVAAMSLVDEYQDARVVIQNFVRGASETCGCFG